MKVIEDIGQIVALCMSMTNLKLDITCGADRAFAEQWYYNHYVTGVHVRYVMKPGLSINSLEDGRVYRAFNTTDAKAVELMEANEAYKDYFIDMQAGADEPTIIPELEGDEPTTIPEVEDEPTTIPELGGEAQPEGDPEPELSEEELAAKKRSEAAKKAAATRAAKKAAEEAAAAAEDIIKEFEQ